MIFHPLQRGSYFTPEGHILASPRQMRLDSSPDSWKYLTSRLVPLALHSTNPRPTLNLARLEIFWKHLISDRRDPLIAPHMVGHHTWSSGVLSTIGLPIMIHSSGMRWQLANSRGSFAKRKNQALPRCKCATPDHLILGTSSRSQISCNLDTFHWAHDMKISDFKSCDSIFSRNIMISFPFGRKRYMKHVSRIANRQTYGPTGGCNVFIAITPDHPLSMGQILKITSHQMGDFAGKSRPT